MNKRTKVLAMLRHMCVIREQSFLSVLLQKCVNKRTNVLAFPQHKDENKVTNRSNSA